MRYVKITCLQCLIVKEIPYKLRHTKFCSKECYWKYKKGKPGHKLSEKTKHKISMKNKGKSKPESVKRAVALSNKNRVWTNESKNKLRIKALERYKDIPKKTKTIIYKHCIKCNIRLPYKRGNRKYCNKCSIIARKEYLLNRNKINRSNYNRFIRYKSKFNISKEDFINILESQHNICAICGNKFKSNKDINLDHCHTTGKIRGILCSKCNLGIGHLNDDIKLFKSAIQYLLKYR